MKLIATLATLAALVGQTEAASSALTISSVTSYNAPCKDKVVVSATLGASTADNAEVKISFKKLTTAGTDLATLIDNAATSCAGSTATTHFDAATAAVADGVTTITLTATATACATPILVTLKDVCNNGVTDFSGLPLALTFKNGADDTTAFASTEAADAGQGPTAIAAFTVTKMPIVKDTEGEFEATFTGVAAMSGKSLVLNLPKDYTIPAGAKCTIKKAADSTGKIITAASDGGLASACTNTCVFSQVIPATGEGSLDTTKATLSCDKVKSGTTIAAPADDGVSIKIHTTSDTNLYAAYASPLTPAPTKSPTAKPDDSPASVATASGVVVGALGVAALFLA